MTSLTGEDGSWSSIYSIVNRVKGSNAASWVTYTLPFETMTEGRYVRFVCTETQGYSYFSLWQMKYHGVVAEPIYVQTLSVTGNSANDFTITSESDNANISNISEPIDIPTSLEFISTAFENSIYITSSEIFPTQNKLQLNGNAAAGDFTLTSNDITFPDPTLSSPASLFKESYIQ